MEDAHSGIGGSYVINEKGERVPADQQMPAPEPKPERKKQPDMDYEA